ncbi:MAG: transglutaminase family protein [Bacteroidia bacterium]
MFTISKQFIYLFLVLLSLQGISAPSEEQPAPHNSIHKETITINSLETGFTSAVYCRGQFNNHFGRETIITINEMEALGGLRARYRNGARKFHDLDNASIQHTSNTDESPFYHGNTHYILAWPNKGGELLEFLYTYRINCKELMALSSLRINDDIRTDTFDYTVRVPKGLLLYYCLPKGANFIQTDSISSNAGMTYHFRSCPDHALNLPKSLPDYVYPVPQPQNIRLIVISEGYRGKSWEYLNDWYRRFEESRPPLSDLNKKLALQIKGSTTDQDSIAARMFQYVQKEIYYFDLGGYLPRDINQVLKTKMGDCKDMSFLLCQLLRSCSVEAYPALSSTLTNETDMDFPCLASADHMICVVKIKKEWKFLDATDPVCPYGSVSRQLQERLTFIIENKGGNLVYINKLTPGSNANPVHLYLKPSGNDLTGNLFAVLRGVCRHDADLTRLLFPGKADSLLLEQYGNGVHGTELNNLRLKDSSSILKIYADMLVKYKFNRSKGRDSIKLNFLPYPHKFPRKMEADTRLVTFQTGESGLECILDLDEQVRLAPFKPVHYEAQGFQFDFEITQLTSNKIRIYYSYNYNEPQILPEQMQTYNELNALMEKTLNEEISYSY